MPASIDQANAQHTGAFNKGVGNLIYKTQEPRISAFTVVVPTVIHVFCPKSISRLFVSRALFRGERGLADSRASDHIIIPHECFALSNQLTYFTD